MESIAASSAIASSPSFSDKRSARRRQSLLPIASKSSSIFVVIIPRQLEEGGRRDREWKALLRSLPTPIPLIRRFSHSPGPSTPDLRVVECAWPLPATFVASGPLVPSTLVRIRTAPCLFSGPGLHQCCGCNVFHKLVDYLNLFHEMKCYVNPSFRYKGDMPFNYIDADDDQDIFSFL
ncbi:hypothetical protein B296_00008284 [Ensete ventricosum]|uniref:Uncharacterized protein n=1 Tax=Ensete ventricosum TaxID=4639 RepID=A0A426YZ78_ENSVE|nr:hypothetical protein B296_00008284 [Ensete ventricosum]